MRTVNVVAGVVRRAGRILIARRAGNDPLAGCWEFPGGTVRRGETLQGALRREWREEFGSEVTPLGGLGDSVHESGKRRIRLLFVEGEAAGDVAALHAHDARAWVRPSELGRYVFAPADRPMVRHLQRAGVVKPLPRVQAGAEGRPSGPRRGTTIRTRAPSQGAESTVSSPPM
jgi:mutator protein MutT